MNQCPLCGKGCLGPVCSKCKQMYSPARPRQIKRLAIDTRAQMRDFQHLESYGGRLAAGFAGMGCDDADGYR